MAHSGARHRQHELAPAVPLPLCEVLPRRFARLDHERIAPERGRPVQGKRAFLAPSERPHPRRPARPSARAPLALRAPAAGLRRPASARSSRPPAAPPCPAPDRPPAAPSPTPRPPLRPVMPPAPANRSSPAPAAPPAFGSPLDRRRHRPREQAGQQRRARQAQLVVNSLHLHKIGQLARTDHHARRAEEPVLDRRTQQHAGPQQGGRRRGRARRPSPPTASAAAPPRPGGAGGPGSPPPAERGNRPPRAPRPRFARRPRQRLAPRPERGIERRGDRVQLRVSRPTRRAVRSPRTDAAAPAAASVPNPDPPSRPRLQIAASSAASPPPASRLASQAASAPLHADADRRPDHLVGGAIRRHGAQQRPARRIPEPRGERLHPVVVVIAEPEERHGRTGRPPCARRPPPRPRPPCTTCRAGRRGSRAAGR